MHSDDLARRILIKASSEYAAKRFDEIHCDMVSQWGKDEYRQSLIGLPVVERDLALQVVDLTLEWLTAGDARRTELELLRDERVCRLTRMDSRWYGLLIDVYERDNPDLYREWMMCLDTMLPVVDPCPDDVADP